nr:hypothetical protein [Paraburkholderia sp. J7]
MKTRPIAALIVVFSAPIGAPAFASCYGPIPFSRPSVGATDSQRGQGVQTLAAERDDATYTREMYGGIAAGFSRADSHAAATSREDLFARH